MSVLKHTFIGAVAALLISGAQPVTAGPDAGAYLAARQAGLANDFGQAARHFTESLKADPANPFLLENAMTSYIALGDIGRAIPIAQTIVDNEYDSQIAHLTLMIADAKADDWAAIFNGLEMGRSVGPLVDRLAIGWAHLGQGDMAEAIASFDQVIATDGMIVYGLTHKAYTLASVGDFEGAEAILSGSAVPGGMRYSRQSAIAHAQILSQLGRNSDALGIIDAVFGSQRDPGIAQLHAQLMADEAVAYSAVRTPAQGLADLFHVIAGMVREDAPKQFTLMYTRAATYLWPENTPAVLMNAALLEDLNNTIWPMPPMPRSRLMTHLFMQQNWAGPRCYGPPGAKTPRLRCLMR
ncbi:TPR domain protein [Roseobacter sp. CCS2]|nr:TPR domain protein [Roseobacter sp. CCS2]